MVVIARREESRDCFGRQEAELDKDSDRNTRHRTHATFSVMREMSRSDRQRKTKTSPRRQSTNIRHPASKLQKDIEPLNNMNAASNIRGMLET